MKFNIKEEIPKVTEQYLCGNIVYETVKLNCRRSTGDVIIEQGTSCILMNEEQAEQLYKHLKTTFKGN